MILYHKGRFRKFLEQRDWNQLAQEITTILIGGGLGLYCYEAQVLTAPFQMLEDAGVSTSSIPASFSSSGAKPYVAAGLSLIIACFVLKISIYFSFFDANTLKKNYRGKKRSKGIDVNGILQEISTVFLGIAVGMFTTPVIKNAFVFEQSQYPDPTVGLLFTFCCLFFKLLLYSKALDFNLLLRKGKVRWKSRNMQTFLLKYNWNHLFQEFSSACVGIGAGFYLHESKIVTVVDKYFPSFSKEIGNSLEKEGAGLWDRISRPIEHVIGKSNFNQITNVQWVPDIFQDERAKMYVMVGMIMVIACFVLKLALYASLWDANKFKGVIFPLQKNKGSKGARRRHFDFNNFLDEILTVLFTIVFGIVTTPVVKNAFLEQKEDYSSQTIWWLLLLFLGWLKFALTVKAISFKRGRSR